MGHNGHHHNHEPGQTPAHPRQPDVEDQPSTEWHRLETAIRELLVEKSIITPLALREMLEEIDSWTPANGSRMVARAWVDPAYKARLMSDAPAAARELGLDPGATRLVVLENTPERHNVVVCTLCSCYPKKILGIPPDWYKSRAYRSRVVRSPRSVLAEFGTTLPDNVAVHVHDSTAELRYLVLPMRPPGTDDFSEEALAQLVTRDTMIGVALPRSPSPTCSGKG